METDLGEMNHGFYFNGIQASHAEEEDEEENQDQNSDDDSEGIHLNGNSLHTLLSINVCIDDGSRVLSPITGDSLSDDVIQALVPLCARLYSIYQVEGTDTKVTYVGSAFKVSKDVVCTASHCVSQEKLSDKYPLKKLTLVSTHVAFKPDTTLVSAKTLINDPCAFKFKPIPKPDYPSPVKQIKFGYTKDQIFVDWKHPIDFCFLLIDEYESEKILEFQKIPYACPEMPNQMPNASCMVIGYPAYISSKDFYEKYPSDDFRNHYAVVKQAFGNFNRRTVSLGTISQALCEGFIPHNAPTLKGSSGGIYYVGSFSSKQRRFHGVHVGGKTAISNNFVIPTDSHDFVYVYFHTMFEALKDQVSVEEIYSYYESNKNFLDSLLPKLPSFFHSQ